MASCIYYWNYLYYRDLRADKPKANKSNAPTTHPITIITILFFSNVLSYADSLDIILN